MTDHIYNSWTEDHEIILKQIAEKSACYRYINFECYNHYKKIDQRFALPVIVLSTLAGSASLGSGNVPAYAAYITIASAIINIITGILGTLQKFLNTTELTSQHFTSSVEYGRLAREIGIMLNLPKQDRTQEGPKFLDYAKGDYNRLVDQTPAPPTFILNQFEKKFGTNEVAKPDLITLVPININTKKLKNTKIPMIPVNASQRTINDIELDTIRQKSFVKKNTFKQGTNMAENLQTITSTLEEGGISAEQLQPAQITMEELRKKYEMEESTQE